MMKNITDPALYDAWYHTTRGRWISDCEFSLLQRLMNPRAGESLLDVGCGTGHFSRLFAQAGLSVTGIDQDAKALDFAEKQGGRIRYILGDASNLPFPANCFDYTAAITSLCFIDDPLEAVEEMWRVTRYTLVLGLLNRQSLLYRQKNEQSSYRLARWDTVKRIQNEWIPILSPAPIEIRVLSAIFLPHDSKIARWVEACMPKRLPLGGFIAISLSKR
ncbi:MAG: class I SAM-dependent methyltransferase [Sedimenticola sp.]